MTVSKHRRLWTPAIAVVAGTAIAIAVGIHESWWSALASELAIDPVQLENQVLPFNPDGAGHRAMRSRGNYM